MNDVIAGPVYEEISEHIREKCHEAEEGWQSANEDEDTLTGDLGATLRRGWTTTHDDEGNPWKWRVTYKKFRGRGKGAVEKSIGADGILQIEVENSETGAMIDKGLLFQSKKAGTAAPKKLNEQVENMEDLVPSGSAVFEFGPKKYQAYESAPVLEKRGHIGDVPASAKVRLGDFLADRFLPCRVGRRGLYYDAIRQSLFVPDRTNGLIRIRRELRHRFRIEVRRP